MKEVAQLTSNLPLHPSSSIFLRQDEDRLDVIRAVITGPVDTPYSLGCFAFDIYCPASYPNNPPLVKLITTGNGTVRWVRTVLTAVPDLDHFSSKVCMSLFHFVLQLGSHPNLWFLFRGLTVKSLCEIMSNAVWHFDRYCPCLEGRLNHYACYFHPKFELLIMLAFHLFFSCLTGSTQICMQMAK